MGKSLSLDIRERVVALVDEGLSCHEAARRLLISGASAVRIVQRMTQRAGSRQRHKDDRDAASLMRSWIGSKHGSKPNLTSRCQSWPRP